MDDLHGLVVLAKLRILSVVLIVVVDALESRVVDHDLGALGFGPARGAAINDHSQSKWTSGPPRMASVAANTRFSWLGDKLQEVETGAVGSKAQRGTAKRDLMRAVFDEIKRKGGGQTTNIFEFLRLILPEEDKARQYHLKEAMLIELYIKVLGAGAELTRKLEKWRTPGASGGGALRGDMADAVSHQLKERCPHSKGLSVLDVANLLDQLSAAQSGDKADRQKARESVIARAITNVRGC